MTSRIWDTSPNPGRIGTKHWCHVITQKYSVVYSHTRFLFFFYFPSHLLCSPFYSLPPSRNSDPGSRDRLFFPPTHCGSCLAFSSREDFSSLFPRRLASNCAYPRSALSAVDPFVFFFAYIFKISPRRDSNARTNTINSSIRGLPLVHRGDRLVCIKMMSPYNQRINARRRAIHCTPAMSIVFAALSRGASSGASTHTWYTRKSSRRTLQQHTPWNSLVPGTRYT